jgi:hypothetical protein
MAYFGKVTAMHSRPYRQISVVISVLLCSHAIGQSPDQPSLSQSFKTAPGQAFFLDLDSAPGAYSQWRHDDVESLGSLQANLLVPRIRKNGTWQPTFTIYLQSKDHRVLANDLALQFTAVSGQLPLKIRLVGHVDGKQMQEIPIKATLSLNDPLAVEMNWGTPQLVTVKIGGSETHVVKIDWPINSVVVAGSTGEMKIDPLLFGRITP